MWGNDTMGAWCNRKDDECLDLSHGEDFLFPSKFRTWENFIHSTLRIEVNENAYAILLLTTRYIDGKYHNRNMAQASKKTV